MNYTVGIYNVNRELGGKEEGGWWYNYGLLEHRCCRAFSQRSKALLYAKRVQKHLDLRYNSRGCFSDLYSVLCEGVMMAEVYQGDSPPYYPQEKPYYC